jgi:hypothetical protein
MATKSKTPMSDQLTGLAKRMMDGKPVDWRVELRNLSWYIGKAAKIPPKV